MDNAQKSIERAQILLNTSDTIDNYVSIKIKPINGNCCCFHCWPSTWEEINKLISPYGPLEDEGDVLIKNENVVFVLECHESGPEIISIDTITNLANFLVTATGLIYTIISSRQKERPNTKFEVIKRKFKNGQTRPARKRAGHRHLCSRQERGRGAGRRARVQALGQ